MKLTYDGINDCFLQAQADADTPFGGPSYYMRLLEREEITRAQTQMSHAAVAFRQAHDLQPAVNWRAVPNVGATSVFVLFI